MGERGRGGGGGGGRYKGVAVAVAETLVAVWAVMSFADATGASTGWYILTSLLWGGHGFFCVWMVAVIDESFVYSGLSGDGRQG